MNNREYTNLINDKINEVIENKNNNINSIQLNIDSMVNALMNCKDDMSESALTDDINKYNKAKAKIKELEEKIEFNTEKLQALKSGKYMTDEESDKVLKELEARERQLDVDTAEKLKPIIESLFEVLNEYIMDIDSLQETKRKWNKKIIKAEKNTFFKAPPTELNTFTNVMLNNYYITNVLGITSESVQKRII